MGQLEGREPSLTYRAFDWATVSSRFQTVRLPLEEPPEELERGEEEVREAVKEEEARFREVKPFPMELEREEEGGKGGEGGWWSVLLFVNRKWGGWEEGREGGREREGGEEERKRVKRGSQRTESKLKETWNSEVGREPVKESVTDRGPWRIDLFEGQREVSPVSNKIQRKANHGGDNRGGKLSGFEVFGRCRFFTKRTSSG